MRLPPMIASLTRHKLTVALMVLATAFTCAIVVNLAAMVAHRLALLDAASGLDESSLVMINSSRINAADLGSDEPHASLLTQYQRDLAALRGIAGVRSAAVVSGMPMVGGMAFGGIEVPGEPGQQEFQVDVFIGGPGELETLGLHLLRGRDFLASEYVPLDDYRGLEQATAAIISRALAMRLFRTDAAVGRLFYQLGHPIRVVGIVDHLLGMRPRLGAAGNEYAMLLPVAPDGDYVTFAMRATPETRDRVLERAEAVLGQLDPQRIFDHATTFTQVRKAYFRRDNAMIGLLLVAGFGLLIVTAAGVAGLASFWVQQRTHAIGIRRALGATRADILRYFHAENFLIVTLGVVVGVVLAVGLNLLLMKHFEMSRMPLWYLPVGAVALWLLGQLAVLAPALRASHVLPVVATRSV